MKEYTIKNPNLFVSYLKDTRYLLIYPDLVNNLIDILTYDLNENQKNLLKMNLSQIIDFRLLDAGISTANLLKLYSNAIVSNQYPKVKLLDISTLTNANIPPLSNSERDTLLAQSGIPFNSQQFQIILNTITDEQLKRIINTILPYQIKSLIKSFTVEQKKNSLIEKENYIGVF